MTYEERKLLDLHQEVEDIKTYIKHCAPVIFPIASIK